VVDNGSDDGTFELLQRLSRELPLSVGRDREPAYYQSEKMPYLAHRAQRAGATWVVPFDADEFWFGVEGMLAEVLTTSKNTVEISQLYNLFPTAS
ncbi:glycosyl transferase family 2, partial [Staphylococcus capitis]